VTYPWLQDVESEFTARLQGKRLAHGLLLSGPEGTGKVELARALLASLLCLEGSYPACGSCRSCRLLSGGAHPDGHVVTLEVNEKTGNMRTVIVVEQVRRLIASLQLTNSVSRRKAALLFPAEAMNRSAANALLKTLEEPVGDAVLLLVSHRPSWLPATVRSRCQALQVRLPEPQAALQWLTETLSCTPDEAQQALEAAAGSPLRARQLLQDGTTEAYRTVNVALDELRAGTADPGAVSLQMGEVDPAMLWTWLSLRAAREMRAQLGQAPLARHLADLQREADRNHGYAGTQVRQDLLLRDWLIQWARLPA